jgi:epoxyqueuosine reductase
MDWVMVLMREKHWGAMYVGEGSIQEAIIAEIIRFVKESPENRFPDNEAAIFDEPLVGFASANDPLFQQYKTIIGEFHLTPQELIAKSPESNGWAPNSVICWVLPITENTRKANRGENIYPSKQWAQTRHFGEAFNVALRQHMVEFLVALGYRAAAPQLMSAWERLMDTPVGIASTWSDRHAAYAAGLGTFSLNDALITPKGIAHRLGSVLTDLKMTPSTRAYPDYRSNCLYFREQTCGVCISRCPAGALSINGHDKRKCNSHVYEKSIEAVGELFGVERTGCGLCQTKVPCEGQIPLGATPYPLKAGL